MARHASDLALLAFDDDFKGEVRLNEPMSKHTTYRIGGTVRAFVEVFDLAALGRVLDICQREELAWFPAGKGSNLLVSDAGFDGVVVVLAGEFRSWTFDDETDRVIVGAGTILSRLVQEVFHRGYSGMEFAVGTPGTVGGAIRMNAGTKDDWIGKRVVSVTAYKAGRGLVRYLASDIDWQARKTSFAPDEMIVECELQLEPALSGNIEGRMRSLLDRRRETQPLDMPSCGSVFRNPDGHSAGALIEGVGLKGRVCGGAQISSKHANFIVNTGSATAADVVSLIELARSEVKKAYGIELTTELRFLGF